VYLMKLDNKGFMNDVKKRFAQEDYRPELVIAAYRNGRILFVKSTRSGVWNLPQEGVHENECIRDAFLRGWAEELCNINIKGLPTRLQNNIKTWIEEEYFGGSLSKPEIFHYDRAITASRSRGIFRKGKKYYFVAAQCLKDTLDLIEKVSPDEVDDIELVNLDEARILMISSGVAFRKRQIVEEALRRLKKQKLIK